MAADKGQRQTGAFELWFFFEFWSKWFWGALNRIWNGNKIKSDFFSDILNIYFMLKIKKPLKKTPETHPEL